LPDNKKRKYGGAYSLYDKNTVSTRDHIIQTYSQPKDVDSLKHEYFEKYTQWMPSSHNLHGIEKYNNLCFTQGTAESFLYFHLKYKDKKRLRILKGEYFFHQMMKNMYYNEFKWLEDGPIEANDAVLISFPFSDTGNEPERLSHILSTCTTLKVPVFLDLAYINLAKGLSLDLTYPCIEYISTSLSKVFPIEFHRVGLRLQRKRDEDQLYVYNEDGYGYLNFMSMHLGLEMMKAFQPTYIFDKYRQKQIDMCSEMNLLVSDCVYFGIDADNKYSVYNRGRDTNRLCFTRIWDGRGKELSE
jgi:hypothetical protein